MINVHDYGTKIRITTNVDLTSVVDSKIYYRKPDGNSGEWSADIVGNAIEYITQSGDIDVDGWWELQAFINTIDWVGTSNIVVTNVERIVTGK